MDNREYVKALKALQEKRFMQTRNNVTIKTNLFIISPPFLSCIISKKFFNVNMSL